MSADASFSKGGVVLPISYEDLGVLGEALDVVVNEFHRQGVTIGQARGIVAPLEAFERFRERVSMLYAAIEGIVDC